MATKPSAPASWATDTNYTGGAENGTLTKVEPTSGRKAEGWEPGQELPAQGLNWHKNLVGQWTEYLDDGMLAGAFGLVSAITPPTIASEQNYAPTGLATAVVLRISSNTSADFIGGIDGGEEGRILIINNVGAADFDLTHEDAGSDPENQMVFVGGNDITVPPNGSVTLRYDGTSDRWRAIASVVA